MRKAKNNGLAAAIVLAGVFAACGGSPSQSDAITDFSKRHDGVLKGFYFYPSTVRMVGNILGDGNVEVLKDIKQGRVFVLWDNESDPESLNFSRVKSDIQAEGFELLMSMKSKGVLVDAYQLDESPPVFVLFVNDPDVPFIIEMTGEMSMNALQGIATMDFDKANELLNLFPEYEEESSEEKEETPNNGN